MITNIYYGNYNRKQYISATVTGYYRSERSVPDKNREREPSKKGTIV